MTAAPSVVSCSKGGGLAIRVRKLAKEFNRSAAQVLGLLHHLGYIRYKSEQDMVGGAALTKLRAAIREGVRADPVLPAQTQKKASPAPSVPIPGMMDELVPGVAAVQQSASATTATTAVGRTDKARRKLAQARAVVDSDRKQVADAQRSVEALQSSLEKDRRALDARRQALEQKEVRLAEEREALRTALPESLAGLLAARGLLGFDEQERALAAMASKRALGSALATLIATDPTTIARLLRDRLVLVDSEVGEGFPGLVAVAVSSDRAEVPSPTAIRKQLDWIGERLLLNGLKRVLIVGGSPRWQGVIHGGMDARIAITFALDGLRSAADATADVADCDVIVRWAAGVGAEAVAVYDGSDRVQIEVHDDTLKACLDAIREGLAGL